MLYNDSFGNNIFLHKNEIQKTQFFFIAVYKISISDSIMHRNFRFNN